MRGTIEGIQGGPMDGVVRLVIKTEERVEHVACEAAPTYRALSAAFGDSWVGREIEWETDDLGPMTYFEPVYPLDVNQE